MKTLHLAVSLRVVAKHMHIPRIPLVQARETIQRLAVSTSLTHEEQQLVDDLEARTGTPIAVLAELTKCSRANDVSADPCREDDGIRGSVAPPPS